MRQRRQRFLHDDAEMGAMTRLAAMGALPSDGLVLQSGGNVEGEMTTYAGSGRTSIVAGVKPLPSFPVFPVVDPYRGLSTQLLATSTPAQPKTLGGKPASVTGTIPGGAGTMTSDPGIVPPGLVGGSNVVPVTGPLAGLSTGQKIGLAALVAGGAYFFLRGK
jgi:hypothetical protein